MYGAVHLRINFNLRSSWKIGLFFKSQPIANRKRSPFSISTHRLDWPEESGWGEQVRRDWKEMEVKDADHWMHLVENSEWLSRKLKAMASEKMTDEGEEDEADG